MTAGPMKVKRDEENRKKLLGDRKKKDGPDDETQVKEIFASHGAMPVISRDFGRAWCGRIVLSETPLPP